MNLNNIKFTIYKKGIEGIGEDKIENMDQYLNLTKYIKDLRKNKLYLFIRNECNNEQHYYIAKQYNNFLLRYKGPIVKENNYKADEFKSAIRSFISTAILVENDTSIIDVYDGFVINENESKYVINLSKCILEASNNKIEIYINDIEESNLIKIIIKSKHFTTLNEISINSFSEDIKNILSTAIKIDKEFSIIEKENEELKKRIIELENIKNILSTAIKIDKEFSIIEEKLKDDMNNDDYNKEIPCKKELVLEKINEKIGVFYEELKYFEYNIDNNKNIYENILTLYEFFVELYERSSEKHFTYDDIKNLKTKYDVDIDFIFLDLSYINSVIEFIKSVLCQHLENGSFKYDIGVVVKNRISKIRNELLIFHKAYEK